MRPVRTAFAGALLGTVVLAGCGQTPAPSSAPSATAPSAAQTTAPAAQGAAFPATVQAGNGAVTIAKKPERIVSISPTATETLFAIGAGPQVVAVDDMSTYPAEAPRTDLSGFKPNVEAIIAHKPDLVVASDDKVAAQLAKVNVPVLVEPAATKIDEAYDEIVDLGVATGNKAKADEVVSGMKATFDRLAAEAPKASKLTYYHELDTTPYAATSTTFIGQIYGMFGLVNVADKAPDAAGGYPKLSAEFVAQADPDLIFLADVKCCQQSKETLAKRPGWQDLKAVKNDRVTQLDDDIASRWGPRIVDLATTIGDAVRKADTSQ
ncbi:ABC transporter substrate-binding protein [Nonomuraea sp. NPDC003804]|uniref:ABC transporter substrate-binding protein n=1 Tax=Nonomuraea sp. NPDC003804 TaxID=3154547 RepID=UPI0033A8FB63